MAAEFAIRSARPDDADQLGLITVSASLSAFVGRLPETAIDFGWRPEHSASGWRRVLDGPFEADEFLSVAVAGAGRATGDVIGFVWAGTRSGRIDYPHLVRGLYVLPTRHGRGVGRGLVIHAAGRLAADGHHALLVGCIRENPACRFYERLGAVEVYRAPQRVDRFETEEIFFGWPSTLELRRQPFI